MSNLLPSDGPVGIGTTSPQDLLHVKSLGNGGAVTVESEHANNTWVRIANLNAGGHIFSVNSSGPNWPGGAGQFFIYDETRGATLLSIDQNGKITIFGDLNVTGNITATGYVAGQQLAPE